MSRLQIESNSSEETKRIAESIGANLKGGEVIELISDLGGGKTIFTIGLAKGMGYEGS
jgi:tRNA threonylcarbamoyladenosine biosynthesis protein TsaE